MGLAVLVRLEAEGTGGALDLWGEEGGIGVSIHAQGSAGELVPERERVGWGVFGLDDVGDRVERDQVGLARAVDLHVLVVAHLVGEGRACVRQAEIDAVGILGDRSHCRQICLIEAAGVGEARHRVEPMGAERKSGAAERAVANGSVVGPGKQVISCGVVENCRVHAPVDGVGLDRVAASDRKIEATAGQAGRGRRGGEGVVAGRVVEGRRVRASLA